MHLRIRVAPIPDAQYLKGKCGVPQNSFMQKPLVGKKCHPIPRAANAPMKTITVPIGLRLGSVKGTLYSWLVRLITMGHAGRVVMRADGQTSKVSFTSTTIVSTMQIGQ